MLHAAFAALKSLPHAGCVIVRLSLGCFYVGVLHSDSSIACMDGHSAHASFHVQHFVTLLPIQSHWFVGYFALDSCCLLRRCMLVNARCFDHEQPWDLGGPYYRCDCTGPDWKRDLFECKINTRWSTTPKSTRFRDNFVQVPGKKKTNGATTWGLSDLFRRQARIGLQCSVFHHWNLPAPVPFTFTETAVYRTFFSRLSCFLFHRRGTDAILLKDYGDFIYIVIGLSSQGLRTPQWGTADWN